MLNMLLPTLFMTCAWFQNQDAPKTLSGLSPENERFLFGNISLQQPEWKISAHDGLIHDIVFSQDQKRMVTSGSDRWSGAKGWDIQTRKELQAFHGAFSPHFLPSGMTFVALIPRGDKDRRATLWDVQECDLKTGKMTLLHKAVEPERPIALWPEIKTAVTYLQIPGNEVTAHLLKFVDYGNKKEARLYQPVSFTVLGFTPDHQLVALRYENGMIKVFDWAAAKEVSEFLTAAKKNENEDVKQLHFCSDNRFAYAVITGFTRRVEKWDLHQGKLIHSFKMSSAVGGIPEALSPDEKVLLVGHGKTTIFYDLKTGKARATIAVKDVPVFRASALCITPDGRSFAIGDTNGQVWKLAMPKLD